MNQELNENSKEIDMLSYVTTQRDKELAITAARNKIQIWVEALERLKDYQKEYKKRLKAAERELKKAEAIKIA